jgi:uncharacterized protein (DUF488 family)
MRIATAGVYGHSEESFFAAISDADIDVFVDTRRRRAVRGHDYAFANSNRLQARLAGMGIRYVHRLDLAPPMALVKAEDAQTRARGIRCSDREALSPDLVAGYTSWVLEGLESAALIASLGDAETILLFCVERTPEACHRSLLADHLARDLGAEVEHILPPD